MSQNLSENNEPHKALSVSQLSRKIKKLFKDSFPENFWIIGEISEFRIHTSGHVYLELIEKEKDKDKIKAKIRATIWSYTFRMLRPYFEGTTGYRIEAGIKVLVSASLEYHPQYGISVNIHDIDPNYTLGDLARKKAEIIERLRSEGVIDMNKTTDFPIVPQRLAVISSETAAGYGDFLDSLNNNPYGYHFTITLFPSLMQGDKAPASIIRSLEDIYSREDHFDLVVIIRGGGAITDLECFNDYDLALNISQFPLPVITGIGHERDETICDLVANKKLKTPTAVAGFLIDSTLEFHSHLENLHENITRIAKNEILFQNQVITGFTSGLKLVTGKLIADKKTGLNSVSYQLQHRSLKLMSFMGNELKMKSKDLKILSEYFLKAEDHNVQEFFSNLKKQSTDNLAQQKSKLEQYEKITEILDPARILNRGFSITYHNGKVLKSGRNLKEGDIIETVLSKDRIKSKVLKR